MKEIKTVENGTLIGLVLEGLFRKKASEIVLIDLSKLENTICNFFIICHGDSNTQVRAIADSVEKTVYQDHSMKTWHKEGIENNQWVLMDYDDIIIHIFQKPFREFYNLEDLWADGILTKIEDNQIIKIGV